MFDIREEDTKFIWTVAVSAVLLELQKAADDCIFIKIIECCSLRIEAFRSTLTYICMSTFREGWVHSISCTRCRQKKKTTGN